MKPKAGFFERSVKLGKLQQDLRRKKDQRQKLPVNLK